MRWPFGPPHLTLKPSKTKNKTKTKKQKKKQKRNKEGLGPSEVALRATSPDPLQKKQKTKNKKQKTKKTKEIKKRKKEKQEKKQTKGKNPKNTKIPKKRAFQLSVFFFFFWWVSKISLFWQLGQKSAHPKNTIKIGVSATHFVENSSESRNGHFWTKKSQIQKFQLSFFFAFFFSYNNKNTKVSWDPYFIVF